MIESNTSGALLYLCSTYCVNPQAILIKHVRAYAFWKKKHSENAKFIIKPTRVFCAGSISSNCFENEHFFWKNTKRNLQWSIILITKQRIKQYWIRLVKKKNTIKNVCKTKNYNRIIIENNVTWSNFYYDWFRLNRKVICLTFAFIHDFVYVTFHFFIG